MNKRMNLPNMQKILMEFERQNERMEMTSDMMGDAVDDAFEVRRGGASSGTCGTSGTVGGLPVCAGRLTCLVRVGWAGPFVRSGHPSLRLLVNRSVCLPPPPLASTHMHTHTLYPSHSSQGEEEEEETDELVSQVLDEIGISFGQDVSTVRGLTRGHYQQGWGTVHRHGVGWGLSLRQGIECGRGRRLPTWHHACIGSC